MKALDTKHNSPLTDKAQQHRLLLTKTRTSIDTLAESHRIHGTMHQMMLRLPRPLSRRALSTRPFSTSTSLARPSSPFTTGPSPPRLPKEDQEIFDRLQRQSTGAFSTPRAAAVDEDAPPAAANTTTTSSSSPSSSASDLRARINQSPDSEAPSVRIEGGDEVHPNLRRGAPPEFEGDVNPKTGEVGGPKNEPLRWGAGGDWSFNGRVTDF